MAKIAFSFFNRLLLVGGLCFWGCSYPMFPVDKDLKRAIQTDLNGRNCFQDVTCIQDSVIFIGIEFNYSGNIDSLKVFHQTAPPFFLLPDAAEYYVGTWKGGGYYLTIINHLPKETGFKSHVNLRDFDTDFDNYFELCRRFSNCLDVSYDGPHYRTLGKYHNGRLIISKSGWFYDP